MPIVHPPSTLRITVMNTHRQIGQKVFKKLVYDQPKSNESAHPYGTPRAYPLPVKLECPKVSYVQVYVWPFCRRTSALSVCVVRACAILSFYNSLTSYELSFLGISNFGIAFFPFFCCCWRRFVFVSTMCVGAAATHFPLISQCVPSECSEEAGQMEKAFVQKSSTYDVS